MRIFASVGTHPQPFNRLVKALESTAKSNPSWKVFIQTGNSSNPKSIPFKKFLDEKEYMKAITEADVIVSHGGAGTIINALRQNKPLVIVPRLRSFKEHTNDHQLDLARALASKGKALCVEGMKGVGKAIQQAAEFKPPLSSERKPLINEIRSFLRGLEK